MCSNLSSGRECVIAGMASPAGDIFLPVCVSHRTLMHTSPLSPAGNTMKHALPPIDVSPSGLQILVTWFPVVHTTGKDIPPAGLKRAVAKTNSASEWNVAGTIYRSHFVGQALTLDANSTRTPHALRILRACHPKSKSLDGRANPTACDAFESRFYLLKC